MISGFFTFKLDFTEYCFSVLGRGDLFWTKGFFYGYQDPTISYLNQTKTFFLSRCQDLLFLLIHQLCEAFTLSKWVSSAYRRSASILPPIFMPKESISAFLITCSVYTLNRCGDRIHPSLVYLKKVCMFHLMLPFWWSYMPAINATRCF